MRNRIADTLVFGGIFCFFLGLFPNLPWLMPLGLALIAAGGYAAP